MVISVAAARVNAGLTQDQSAKALNISKSTYINYETGRTSPSVEMAGKISELFGIPITNIRFSK